MPDKFQTFLKLDLDKAIDEEIAAWNALNKRLPPNQQVRVPFSPFDCFWPEIENSQKLRAKTEYILPPQPLQNASQSNDSSTDNDIQYLMKYRRGLEDAEKRRMNDINKINKDYAKDLEDWERSQLKLHEDYNEALNSMIKSGSLGASNMDTDYGEVNDRVSMWLSKKKNDDPEIHWLWRYCIPYIAFSGLARLAIHLLTGM